MGAKALLFEGKGRYQSLSTKFGKERSKGVTEGRKT